MNDFVGKLLKPVSEERPCGSDISNEPRFDALERTLKGKPEVDIGSVKQPAEPPDWRELKSKSEELLSQSKHLRVGVIFCCCLLKTEGLPGFRDGLQLIRGLLEQYWSGLYPLLDPEDHNDPTERLNILGGLTAKRGAMGLGWLAILDYLYAAPICRPKGGTPITFDQIQAAKKAAGGEGASAASDAAKLAAAIRDAGDDQIATYYQTLQEVCDSVRQIDQFLTTTLGAGNTISFEVLENSLQEMLIGLKAYLPGSSVEKSGLLHPEVSDVVTAGFAGIPATGSIRSRDDVVRAIESICDFYRQAEPSSAVPYLLRRAQKLAKMDFVQAMQELNLATVDALRPSMGSAVDSAVSSETPAG